MHTSIEENLPKIATLCRRFGVRRLELFGSAARGADFDPFRSDADFLVEFDATRNRDPLEQFFGRSRSLEAILGRPIDLLERGAIENPYLMRRIDDARELIYEA